MTANTPKKHHVVPRVLLKYFAENDRVMVVPINGESIRFNSIQNVSVISHVNTLDTLGGRDLSIEAALSRIEGYYPRIVDILSQTERTKDDDALVLSLVATQLGRDPIVREGLIADEVTTIYEALKFALREDNPEISEEEIDDETEFYGRHHVVQSHVVPTPKNVAVAATSALIIKWYEDLASQRLTILRAQAGAFITADSAVSIYPDYSDSKFESEAAFMKQAELVLPITPNRAVLVTACIAEQVIDVGLDIVAIVNARTARGAKRELYASPSYPPSQLRTDLSGWWAKRSLIIALGSTGSSHIP